MWELPVGAALLPGSPASLTTVTVSKKSWQHQRRAFWFSLQYSEEFSYSIPAQETSARPALAVRGRCFPLERQAPTEDSGAPSPAYLNQVVRRRRGGSSEMGCQKSVESTKLLSRFNKVFPLNMDITLDQTTDDFRAVVFWYCKVKTTAQGAGRVHGPWN